MVCGEAATTAATCAFSENFCPLKRFQECLSEEILLFSLLEKYRHRVPDRKNISRVSSINTIKILIDFRKAGTTLMDRDLVITHHG